LLTGRVLEVQECRQSDSNGESIAVAAWCVLDGGNRTREAHNRAPPSFQSTHLPLPLPKSGDYIFQEVLQHATSITSTRPTCKRRIYPDAESDIRSMRHWSDVLEVEANEFCTFIIECYICRVLFRRQVIYRWRVIPSCRALCRHQVLHYCHQMSLAYHKLAFRQSFQRSNFHY
jgi:hypothetical protein